MWTNDPGIDFFGFRIIGRRLKTSAAQQRRKRVGQVTAFASCNKMIFVPRSNDAADTCFGRRKFPGASERRAAACLSR